MLYCCLFRQTVSEVLGIVSFVCLLVCLLSVAANTVIALVTFLTLVY